MDAAQWDERYRAADLVWGAEPNRFVRQLCERLPVGTAVDLACGEGRNALWLARIGWQVLGLDFSAAAIERARALADALPEDERVRATWRVQDLTVEAPRAEAYDLTLISYVHISADENDRLVSAGARSLRPGGHLVIVGHDRRNLLEGVGGPQDSPRLYDPAEIAFLLRGAGLDIDLADTLERPTDDGVALDTVVRARRPRDS